MKYRLTVEIDIEPSAESPSNVLGTTWWVSEKIPQLTQNAIQDYGAKVSARVVKSARVLSDEERQQRAREEGDE